MKKIKFKKVLSELILSWEKYTTWRLFDDKNLSKGDVVSFLISETKQEFAKAKLLDVKETTFEKLTDEDWEWHEKFSSDEEMYETYSKYYKCRVDKDTFVEIIKFELL